MTLKVRGAVLCLTVAVSGAAFAQDQALTLAEALRLARQQNGTIRSAELAVTQAEARAKAVESAFMPTLTPSATQNLGRLEQRTGLNRGGTDIDDLSLQIDAAWTLLDNGGRRLNSRDARLNVDASRAQAQDTLRRLLFDVHSRYLEALRREELLRVQNRQVERADSILKETTFRNEIGDGARKDIKQAEADFLNAQVSRLAAETRIQTSRSDLKAALAWGPTALPRLERPEGLDRPEDLTLEKALAEGLAARPDLLADRVQIDRQKVALRQAQLEGGPNWSVGAGYRRSFSEDVFDRALLTFQVSVPLFDGFRTREQVRAQRLAVEAAEARLAQTELNARSEIESAWVEFTQNDLRLQAAQKALEAAQLNFEFSRDAQKEGAGTLLEVLTAQVTLTTAESNRVEAEYDALLSGVRLLLVTGRPLPGLE